MRLSITYEMHFNFTGMGHGDKYEDSSLDVFQYFNSSCYCGYSDDDQVVTSFTSLLYLFSLSQNLKWSLISLILTMYPLKLKTQQNNNHTLVCNKEMKPTYIFSVFLNYLTAVLNKQTSWLHLLFESYFRVSMLCTRWCSSFLRRKIMSSWMTRRATRKFRDLGEVTVRMRRCLLSSHIYLRRLNGPVILRLFFSPGYEDLCIKI